MTTVVFYFWVLFLSYNNCNSSLNCWDASYQSGVKQAWADSSNNGAPLNSSASELRVSAPAWFPAAAQTNRKCYDAQSSLPMAVKRGDVDLSWSRAQCEPLSANAREWKPEAQRSFLNPDAPVWTPSNIRHDTTSSVTVEKKEQSQSSETPSAKAVVGSQKAEQLNEDKKQPCETYIFSDYLNIYFEKEYGKEGFSVTKWESVDLSPRFDPKKLISSREKFSRELKECRSQWIKEKLQELLPDNSYRACKVPGWKIVVIRQLTVAYVFRIDADDGGRRSLGELLCVKGNANNPGTLSYSEPIGKNL